MFEERKERVGSGEGTPTLWVAVNKTDGGRDGRSRRAVRQHQLTAGNNKALLCFRKGRSEEALVKEDAPSG